MASLIALAQAVKRASRTVRLSTEDQKNQALQAIAAALTKHQSAILKANRLDVEKAQTTLPPHMIDRLTLTEKRLEGIIHDIDTVIRLPDPTGKVLEEKTLPNGLILQKVSVPLGVLGIIYEARPNVTVDVTCLALKSGNGAILRGGKETLKTNGALLKAIQEGLEHASFPRDAIQLIKSPSRRMMGQLLKLDTYVDLIIPRGGEGLHRFCREHSHIPVITGGMGICHLFVDESADLEKSLTVIENAKVQRPSVCNALDTVLIHEKIASRFLPLLIKKLESQGVVFHLDPTSLKLASGGGKHLLAAEEKDWQTEWLSLHLGVKVVPSIVEAINHIQAYSTSHSDGILTTSRENGERFVHEIDSATVYINASTRFTDGGQFGMGAEVAVSTQKVHARGPMGLRELTTYKWIVKGNYQVRG